MKKALYLLFLPLFAVAQEPQKLGYPTGAEFLNINTDLKSSSMGNVRTTGMPDASSVFSNPAKLAFAQPTVINSVGVSYTPIASALAKDIKLISLASNNYIGGDEFSASYLSGFINYMGYGDVTFTDQQGNTTEFFRPREYAVGLSFIKRYGEFFSLSASAKGIFTNLAPAYDTYLNAKASAFAMDLGFFSEIPVGDGFAQFGLSAQNIGSGLRYDASSSTTLLPQVVRLGGSYQFLLNNDNISYYRRDTRSSYFLIGIDVNKPLIPYAYASDKNGSFDALGKSFSDWSGVGVSFGAELMFHNSFGLRAGYSKEPNHFAQSSYFSAGTTLAKNIGNNRIGVDFAYEMPVGKKNFGHSNTFRIGLSYNLSE